MGCSKMANEKRLIDANALIAEYDRVHIGPPGGARKLIANAPVVDAVELPCKMGDLVWGIKRWNRGQKAIQGVAYQMYFGEDMRLCICVKNVCRGEWGRNVFATKEETEAAIRGRKDNERKTD